ncbi:MAG: hypothetical protein U1E81_19425 [Xanthobacteraceae bacterium]
MGADFIEKATPTFKKSWDRARVALGTADLFTREPSCAARTAAAEIVGRAKLSIGDRVTVEPHGAGLVALRGNTEVARFTKPSAELVKAVNDSCGVAKGVVEQVHDLAGVAEISLC